MGPLARALAVAILWALCTPARAAPGRIVDFESEGAIRETDSLAVQRHNAAIFNAALARLRPGDTFRVPEGTFHIMGGLFGSRLVRVTLQFDGVLSFSDDIRRWPRGADGRVLPCLCLEDLRHVTLTSATGGGVLDGNGKRWWGVPGLGYLVRGEDRPRLLEIRGASEVLVERLSLVNAPYWTFWAHGVDGLEVRHTQIDARRTEAERHDLLDMTAFNTDGFDVSGARVWIHDCRIWCQDDAIAVKEESRDMVFERLEASGVGLSIGSIGAATVRNITFRDIHMLRPYKGIYLKFREGADGVIADVLFENITIEEPSQWPIWIGPAQQSDSRRLCAPQPCSICWPFVALARCEASMSTFRNVRLSGVAVQRPRLSPGVLLAHAENPAEGIVFHDVVVEDPPAEPWGDDYYYCEGVGRGVATGRTWPVPPCFQDRTRGADGGGEAPGGEAPGGYHGTIK